MPLHLPTSFCWVAAIGVRGVQWYAPPVHAQVEPATENPHVVDAGHSVVLMPEHAAPSSVHVAPCDGVVSHSVLAANVQSPLGHANAAERHAPGHRPSSWPSPWPGCSGWNFSTRTRYIALSSQRTIS